MSWLRIAILGVAGLLTIPCALAQVPLDDQQLVRLVNDAVSDQTNRGAFRQVLQQYDRYRQLVAEGKIGNVHAEVLDNQIWDLSMREWDKIKARYPDLERVDLVGSGGRRLEPGNLYQVGKSDLDFIPRGPQAAEAATEYRRRLAREFGVDPQKIGINALSPVQAERRALIEAASHPEKYCTPERLKALDYQQYRTGMTIVWEGGQSERVPVRDLYARNGWSPPPEPTALDAFGSAAGERKFLQESVRKGLGGAEKAVYEAKYHVRTLDSALQLGGVDLPGGGEAIQRELRAIAESKSVRTALADRIARHGGNVEAAVAEYLRDASNLNKQVTTDLLRNHLRLLKDKAAAGGQSLVEAQQSARQLQHSLALFSDAELRGLLKDAGLKPANIEQVAQNVSKLRIEIAVQGERAAIEAKQVARFLASHAPPAERAAVEARILALSEKSGGRWLLQNMAETIRKQPVSSGLIALAALSEVQRISSIAGEKGWAEGSLAAGNAAGDWYLMSLSPKYAVARLTIDLGKLGVEYAITGPVKEATARAAYEGAAGFLAHVGLSRGELTRRFATEADALREARHWYQRWMVNHGEYLGKTEVEEAFYRQVRADYTTSRWLQVARDASFDPATGEYGGNGFFRRIRNGQVTFENFAECFPNEGSAQRIIDLYLEEIWYYDWEKYGGTPADRKACEETLRRYLMELWKASAKFQEELSQARKDARHLVDSSDTRRGERNELTIDDLLETPGGGSTATVDAIRAAPTVPDALRQVRLLLGSLERMAEAIRGQIVDLNRLSDILSANERALDVYQQAIDADREFVEQTTRRLAILRIAIARGALQSASLENLQAEFRAVRIEADRITAEADSARAQYEAGRLSPAAARQQYLVLLERFQRADGRFVPARDAFEQLEYVSRIYDAALECETAQLRSLQHIEAVRDMAEELHEMAEGIEGRLAELLDLVDEFEALKAELEPVFAELQDRAGNDLTQHNAIAQLRSQWDACIIPGIPVAESRAVGNALQGLVKRCEPLVQARLPRSPEFQEFEQWAETAAELVEQVGPDRYAAEAALDRAREALNRLAQCIESRPIVTVQTPPPPPADSPPTAPPGPIAGGIRIRETSRNVFVVEMAAVPPRVRFLWDFGDGTPPTETAQPQVQHNYAAPAGGLGGLSGLAGKQWRLSVTVVVDGRLLGSAAYTVSRSRLTDSPIR